MPAVVTIRDNRSGATIDRATPIAELMIARDPHRYEIVEGIQPRQIARAFPPLDSRRRKARQPVPPGLILPDDVA